MPTVSGEETSKADSYTRFGGPRGNPNNGGGRTPTAWIRKILGERSETGAERREHILRHLIDVATKWEVRVIGRDSDGELLKVASARDAVEAAKLLMTYDMGKPSGELDIAEHMRKVARDGADLAIKILGTRIYSMAPKELAEFFRECGGNPAGFLEAAKRAEEQVPAVEAQPEVAEGFPLTALTQEEIAAREAAEPTAPVLPDSDDGWPKP